MPLTRCHHFFFHPPAGLYLQNNKLEKLHSSVGKCLKLETINVEDNCLKKIGKKVVQLEKLKYFLLANNQLSELPFNPHSTSRGLRRLTLRGNMLDMKTLALDTDVQEERRLAGAGASAPASKGEAKFGAGGMSKLEPTIEEGDEEEDEDENESHGGK